MLEGKRILIGIGGGIAAYRTAELARLLKRKGAEVRSIMTRSACEFISPLTLESLTGEPAHTELFDLTAEREMGHIRLARWADVLLVAPATANLLAKFTHGICDDLLTTLFQVREGPVVIAPSMNSSMWKSVATKQNVGHLMQRGIAFIGPDAGELACGEEGPGRLADPETVMQAVYRAACPDTLAGQTWLINAGPTFEYWDDVRFLGNRASGRFGFAMARAAAARGASVRLVAGPAGQPTPLGVERHDVVSADEMLSVCMKLAGQSDVFVATAAVGDFCFAEPASGKFKRDGCKSLDIRLSANPDIVASIAGLGKRPGRIIAFAAECEHHVAHARTKLAAKGVDAIVANDAAAMGRDSSGAWWITPDKTEALAEAPKWRLAEMLIERICALPTGGN